jgi:hypothetical protein
MLAGAKFCDHVADRDGLADRAGRIAHLVDAVIIYLAAGCARTGAGRGPGRCFPAGLPVPRRY